MHSHAISILVVEDDRTFLKIIQSFLQKHHFNVVSCSTAEEAYRLILKHEPDLVLTDYKLPDESGLEILKWIKANKPSIKSMIMTRYSDVKTAIHSMKLGALDFIIKPVNPDVLLTSINEAMKKKPDQSAKMPKKEEGSLKLSNLKFVKGNSTLSDGLYKKVELVGPTDMSVIIQGESGTGKEHIARLIHSMSDRKDKPFVALDCGALSLEIAQSEIFGHVKGAFTGAVNDKTGHMEMANEGTIFLDEIGNLSYEIQIQLLRAIQERVIKKVGGTSDIKIDVRIIVATNENLRSAIENGDFRRDLYHRLNEFVIAVPPLRDRDNDIFDFVDYFIGVSNKELSKNVKRLSAEAKNVIKNYRWPGNIRELKNIIKRAVLLSDSETLGLNHFPQEIIDESKKIEIPRELLFDKQDEKNDLKSIIRENEKDMIIKTLLQYKYNKSKTAMALKIDRKTLYNKMRKYNLEI